MNGENRTLIIVDDEPETLKGYVEFLNPKAAAPIRKSSRRVSSLAEGSSSEQYRLLSAESGEEAIRLIQEEMKQGGRVAAGFFDVKLEGGMDGIATIQAIKAIDKDIHCAVVTAYHDRSVDEIQQLFGEEFKDQWDYLNKPFTQGEIVQKARNMIAAWNRKRKIEALNAQLIRSERFAAIGQVARGIGHEFGNILLRIIGKTDLALMESDAKKIHDHLQVVMKAAERAGIIVRNLQSFSKAEPNFRHIEITVPLDEAISLMNHEFVKNSIRIKKQYHAHSPTKIDTGGMAQVFLNLLINAVHAMPKGGEIVVEVDQAQGEVLVRVKDTGTGIPENVLPRIFDFAFTTKGDCGSGLGLSISKEIIEAHGGSISVSTAVGKGTEFSVHIPIREGVQ